MNKYLLFFTICVFSNVAIAQVSLSNYFSDHMALRRNQSIVILGKASAGERISVSFKSQTKKTIATEHSNWKITLNPEKEAVPYKLKVIGENEIILSDILLGDVWVCSEPSNIKWNTASVDNAEKEMKEADFLTIRQIKIQKEISRHPLEDIKPTAWKVATPDNIHNFMTVGYYFARKQLAETNIPIGLINTSWGVTNIETWISATSLSTHPDYRSIASITPEVYSSILKKQKQSVLDEDITYVNSQKVGSC